MPQSYYVCSESSLVPCPEQASYIIMSPVTLMMQSVQPYEDPSRPIDGSGDIVEESTLDRSSHLSRSRTRRISGLTPCLRQASADRGVSTTRAGGGLIPLTCDQAVTSREGSVSTGGLRAGGWGVLCAK